ncbi:MAG: hypothetical protein EZS28_055387, partial [Streblomastix strix]
NPIPDEVRETIRAFEVGVKFAEEWIPVERELPEKAETVLYKRQDSGRKRGFCYGQVLQDKFLASVSHLITPTHWRPINHKGMEHPHVITFDTHESPQDQGSN